MSAEASAREIEQLKATVATLTAQLAATTAAGVAVAPAAAAAAAAQPPLRTHAGVAAVLAAHALVDVPSPRKVAAAKSIFKTLGKFDFAATPLSACLRPLAAAPSLKLWHELTADEVLDEEQGYPRATASVPAWIVAHARKAPAERDAAPRPSDERRPPGYFAASTLFLSPGGDVSKGAPPKTAWPVLPGASIPWACQPELLNDGARALPPRLHG